MPTKEMERFAAYCLLRDGFIDLDVDDALAGFDLDPTEEEVVRVMWDDPDARCGLQAYWRAYERGRLLGTIPAVREPWYD